jgi:predicted metalloprotease with PDZ domain
MDATNPGKTETTLGISTALENGRLLVKYVERDLPGWKGGLNVNDELIAVDGRRTGNSLDEVNRLLTANQQIQVLVNRSGMIRTLTLNPETVTRAAWKLEAQSAPAVQNILNILLD